MRVDSRLNEEYINRRVREAVREIIDDDVNKKSDNVPVENTTTDEGKSDALRGTDDNNNVD